MPIITPSSPLKPPRWHFGAHTQTIIPGLTRKIPEVQYQRMRIATPDDDFLDLDCLLNGNDRVLIITHGLEGSASSQYVLGTARLFSSQGWDVIAWNCRSCSGEMNKQFRLYYHGDTEDISTVINHAIQSGYQKIGLAGFSMGANITMKYLGIHGTAVPPEIVGAAVFSAPCDIEKGAEVLDKPSNWIYKNRFMSKLVKKIKIKNEWFPGRIDISKLKSVRTWRDFDEYFSAPMCGFPDANAFYRDASSKYFIDGIRVPTLLASAVNDPILTPECFPVNLAAHHPYFHLEMPTLGGHCGFMVDGEAHSWAEMRALEWLEQ